MKSPWPACKPIERQTALVEDLLLLARLDEGKPLKLSEVDLTQLVVESVSDEKVMAPGHNWRLELPEEPVLINGDASQLRQVFSRFARADAARKGMGDEATASAAEGSSGLGLSIVESIVEAHGGRVTVHHTRGGLSSPFNSPPVTCAARRRAAVVISVTKM